VIRRLRTNKLGASETCFYISNLIMGANTGLKLHRKANACVMKSAVTAGRESGCDTTTYVTNFTEVDRASTDPSRSRVARFNMGSL